RRKPTDRSDRGGIGLGGDRRLAPIGDRWRYRMTELGGEIAIDPCFDDQPVDAPAALGAAALDRAAELETVDEIAGIDVDEQSAAPRWPMAGDGAQRIEQRGTARGRFGDRADVVEVERQVVRR